MNEAPDGEREPAGYVRLPWPVVGAGLFVLLALVLGLGLFANRNLRPQIGVVPTPSPVAAATPTALPVAAPAAVQASTPTVAPPSAALTATAAATPAATGTVAPGQTTPLVVVATPTELPTVEPALAEEVGKAYLTFWRVKSQALLELDPSHLSDVMEGDYLATTTQLIEELRSEGRAIKTHVTLNYFVVEVGAETATVVDNFDDDSIYVAIGTEDALTSATPDKLSVLYQLRKFRETWKVVDSVRPQ